MQPGYRYRATRYIVPGTGLLLTLMGMLPLAFACAGTEAGIRYAPVLLGVGCNTALSLLLAGLALFMFPTRRGPELMAFLGWLLVSLALVNLVLAGLGWAPEDGPWRMLVNTLPADQKGAWPGRMSPTTAFCLLLAGLVMASIHRINGMPATLTALAALALLLGVSLTAASLNIQDIHLFSTSGPVLAFMSLPSSAGLLLLWLGLTQVGMETWLPRFFVGHAERRILLITGLVLFVLLLLGSVLNNNLYARQILDSARQGMLVDLTARQLSFRQELAEAEQQARRLADLLGESSPAELRSLSGSARHSMVPGLTGLALRLDRQATRLMQGELSQFPGIVLHVAGGRSHLQWDGRWLIETQATLPGQKGILILQKTLDQLLQTPFDLRGWHKEGELLVCATPTDAASCFSLHPATAHRPGHGPTDLLEHLGKTSGQGVALDLIGYGHPAILAYVPVADTGLTLVAAAPTAPLLSTLRAGHLSSALLLALLVLLGILTMARLIRPILGEMERTQRDFRLLFESVNDGIIGIDRGGAITRFNRAAQGILGYPPDELMGRLIDRVMYRRAPNAKQDADRACRAHATLRDGQAWEENGIVFNTRDGHTRIVDCACNPVLEGGIVTGAVLTFRDITHSRGLERRLGLTENILARAQRVAHMGSWYQEEEFVEWSQEARNILALAPDQAFTLSDLLALAAHEERESVMDAWRRGHFEGKFDITFRTLGAHGERWLRIRADLETDGSGRLLSSIGTVVDTTEHKDQEQDLLRSRTKLRELAAYREKAKEDERAYIARELHDHLGQYLTALHMDANLVQALFAKGDEELIARLDGMKQLIEHTINEVRGVIARLRPMALDLGLASAAEWLVRDFEKRTGVICHLDIATPDLNLDADRETTLFRILQEALTNVARHARAKHLDIRFESTGGVLRLDIRDDGRGFDHSVVRAKKSFGLMGIRERVLIYGGSAKIDSKPGMGTSLRITFPTAKGDAE